MTKEVLRQTRKTNIKQEEVELTKENADNDNDIRLQHGSAV